MKAHLKSITAPKTWQVGRKKNKFIARPKPGAHKLETSMPMLLVLRDVLKLAESSKEAKYILTHKEVLVDGKKRRDTKYPVGLMDVLSIPDLKLHFRGILTTKNKLVFMPISKEESEFKLSKIINKSIIRKKVQLNLSDGRNILLDKNNYGTGDSLALKLPSQEIIKHLPLKEGCLIYLTAGEHKGATGKLSLLKGNTATVLIGGQEFETPKKNLFVTGDEKPMLDVSWSKE
jgi:small subunit ribosomal protein S4e